MPFFLSKMSKQIIYLIGAYGCGKTTAVKNIAEKRADIFPIIEDKTTLHFLQSKNITLRSHFYMPVYFYRIKKAIEETEKPIILVDGHPMIPFFYMQCFFEMEGGHTVTIRDILNFGALHNSMVLHCQEMLMGNPQKVIHIELPIEKHWDMVLKRFVGNRMNEFGEEADIDYLKTIRRVFNQHAKMMAEEMYYAEYVKVDNLEKIEELI